MFGIIKNKKAFTLLEIIIVTFIISLGLLGVMSLFVQTIKVQNINKNELIASQLAQEGIEIIRNIRDENWDVGNWNDDLSADTYALDYNGRSSLVSVTGINDTNTNLKLNSGVYQLSGMESTPFNRIISIIDLIDYLDVVCTVQWNERGNKKQYTVQTYLYDWK